MNPTPLLTLALYAATITPAATQTPQQKAPPSPSAQAQLEERVKKLENELSDQKQKLAAAELEKSYIERREKDAKDYYDSVLAHETAWLGIIALIITIVPGFAAIFSFRVFNGRIRSSTLDASQRLRRTIDAKMRAELETLRQENTALEDTLTKLIQQQIADLEILANFNQYFSLGMTAASTDNHDAARKHFRGALGIYVKHKDRRVISASNARWCVRNLFLTFKLDAPQTFSEQAKKELEEEDELYALLKEELAYAAEKIPELKSLLAPEEPQPGSTE